MELYTWTYIRIYAYNIYWYFSKTCFLWNEFNIALYIEHLTTGNHFLNNI